MSTEFGESLAKRVSTKMSREALEAHIKSRMSRVTMCVLSTSKDDVPRGTPMEAFADGFTFYVMPDPGIKRVNIKANSNVSISIFENVAPKWEIDWKEAWGLQISGKGEMLEYGQPGWAEGLKAMKVDSFLRALGNHEGRNSLRNAIIRVIPDRIELTEWGFPAKGYARKQVWKPEGDTEIVGQEAGYYNICARNNMANCIK